MLRGYAFGLLGDTKRAIEEYTKAVGTEMRYSAGASTALGYALLNAGDQSSYRDYCARLWDTFHDSRVAENLMHTAWFCALSPLAPVERSSLVQIARKAASDPELVTEDAPRLTLAATLYRDGKFDEAEPLFDELIQSNISGDALDRFQRICSEYFLAMTLHETARSQQAVALLDEANSHVANKGVAGWHMTVLESLRREAEVLIGQPTSDTQSESESTQRTVTGEAESLMLPAEAVEADAE